MYAVQSATKLIILLALVQGSMGQFIGTQPYAYKVDMMSLDAFCIPCEEFRLLLLDELYERNQALSYTLTDTMYYELDVVIRDGRICNGSGTYDGELDSTLVVAWLVSFKKNALYSVNLEWGILYSPTPAGVVDKFVSVVDEFVWALKKAAPAVRRKSW